MGIFGQRDPLGIWAGAGPITTPGFGDGTSQGGLPQDPRIAQAMKPGFFSAGGNGRNLIGILGDAMAAAGGGRPYYGPAMLQQKQQDRQQQQEDERWQKRLTHETQAKRQTPQAVNLGNGGFGVWSPDGGLRIEREPQQQPGEQERLLERYLDPATPDNIKEVIRPMLRGANLDASVMAPIIQLKTDAAQEVKQTVPGKAAGAGGGGPSITPTARAKYIAEAQAAISRGADPAKVQARLQQMGVQ